MLKVFPRMLMNEAAEVEQGGAPEVNDFGEKTAESLFSELGLDASKYNLDESEPEESVEVAKEGDENNPEEDKEAAQETEESAYLKWVNSLGAEREGQPITINSKDEVKNALQMYKDYTVKTQSLSEERKVFESEKSQAEQMFQESVQELNQSIQKHQEQLRELEQWSFALDQLKQSAPDIFEEIQRAYTGVKQQFTNPILEQQLKAIREEMEPLKKNLTQRENELILKGFESEWEASKSVEQSLSELGIKLDKDQVMKEWANTGLSVNKVIGALYGEQILKAQASKAKVATVQKKVAAKPTGAASNSRPGARVPEVRGTKDYLDAVTKLYQSYRG